MNTRAIYAAIRNDVERAAAISIIVDVQKHLKEKPGEHLFTVKKKCPQFTENATIFVNNELKKDVATIAFCFVPGDENGEVTATVTLSEEALAS